jgi:hypothetical protein
MLVHNRPCTPCTNRVQHGGQGSQKPCTPCTHPLGCTWCTWLGRLPKSLVSLLGREDKKVFPRRVTWYELVCVTEVQSWIY